MQVIGYRRADFRTDDGQQIEGWTIYLTEQRQGVEGLATERTFLSTRKSAYQPQLGDELQVYYNKYGKVEHVELI